MIRGPLSVRHRRQIGHTQRKRNRENKAKAGIVFVRPLKHRGFWRDDRVLLLRQFHYMTASEAADRIGDGCTRNMVIAKRNRLRLVVFKSDIDRGWYKLAPQLEASA